MALHVPVHVTYEISTSLIEQKKKQKKQKKKQQHYSFEQYVTRKL